MPRWRAIGASVCGESHRRTGSACQDRHQQRSIEGELWIAAIADGAGSAALGEVGADLASRFAASYLEETLLTVARETAPWSELARTAIVGAREMVHLEAARRDVAPRELACTLMVIVAAPYRVAVSQIGDGAAVALTDDDTLIALTQPQQGEYPNETVFLVSPDAIEQMQTTERNTGIDAVAVFTDGLQRVALTMGADGALPHRPFFDPLFRFLRATDDPADADAQLHRFLTSPRLAQRTDDDLTLVLACRPESAP